MFGAKKLNVTQNTDYGVYQSAPNMVVPTLQDNERMALKTTFLQLLMYVFLYLFAVTGCSSSQKPEQVNGEGYGGRTVVSNYYWSEPGYTCENNPSYKGSVTVYSDGTAEVTGDECSSSVQTVQTSELDASANGELVAYNDGLYEKSSVPLRGNEPTRLVPFAFCKVPNGNIDFILRIGASPLRREVQAFSIKGGVFAELFKQDVDVTNVSTWRFFTSQETPPKFTSSINFSLRPDRRYPGSLWLEENGVSNRYDISCRLLIHLAR